jgi:hypothetical protein
MDLPVRQELLIKNIPAVLWGEPSDKILVAVHGHASSKTDAPIALLAGEAVPLGYQVLSFDLPQHGDRKNEPALCKVQNCVQDIHRIMDFAAGQAGQVSLFACSMGAYFSLLACRDLPVRQSLFLSPIVDMKRLINNMMAWFDVSPDRLRAEQEIALPTIGQTLYWDYYCYVRDNPVTVWESPTAILYGEADNLCEYEVITSFAQGFGCSLTVMKQGEHYFHTPAQLEFYRRWLKQHLPLVGT